MENYSFKIRMKWMIINSLPFTNSEDPSMKILIQLFSPFLVYNILHVPFLIVLSFGMLQTLLSQVTLLVRDLSESSPQLISFQTLTPSGFVIMDSSLFFLIVTSCTFAEGFHHLLPWVLFFSQQRIYRLVHLGTFCCLHMSRLKPKSWLL